MLHLPAGPVSRNSGRCACNDRLGVGKGEEDPSEEEEAPRPLDPPASWSASSPCGWRRIVLQRWLPRDEIRRHRLHGCHPVNVLITDLMDAQWFEVHHALLEVRDSLIQVGAPVVGEAVIDDGFCALEAWWKRLRSASHSAPNAWKSVHRSRRGGWTFLEHVADVGIHCSPRSLKAGEVVVGCRRGLQSSSAPRLDGSDTVSNLRNRRRRRRGFGSPPNRLSALKRSR